MKCNLRSAKGAKCNSQGQVRAQRSTSPLEHEKEESGALKVRNRFQGWDAMSLFQSFDSNCLTLQGRRASLRSHLPLAIAFPRLRRLRIKPLINSTKLHFQIESVNDK